MLSGIHSNLRKEYKWISNDLEKPQTYVPQINILNIVVLMLELEFGADIPNQLYRAENFDNFKEMAINTVNNLCKTYSLFREIDKQEVGLCEIFKEIINRGISEEQTSAAKLEQRIDLLINNIKNHLQQLKNENIQKKMQIAREEEPAFKHPLRMQRIFSKFLFCNEPRKEKKEKKGKDLLLII